MIQDVGNVELFELFETDLETQCKACLSYWSEGIVYCTCGYLFKDILTNRGFIKYTLDISQFQSTSSKRENFVAIDMGKLQKRKNITWPII